MTRLMHGTLARLAIILGTLAAISACNESEGHTRGSGGTAGGTSSAGPGSTNQSPVYVTLAQPLDGARYDLGQAVALTGSAVDAAGQPIAASGLQWASSIDGALGSGAALTLAAPTPGIHTIDLVATDAQGNTGSATVRIAVAGAGGRTGQDLVSYLLSLPYAFLGNPIQIPPDLFTMAAANPTDVNATTGAGGLAAALSQAGTVTVLRWPSPSYYDQVDYLAQTGRRPGFGALENMGVFAGVTVTLGGRPQISWLRDPTWRTTQRYLDDQADVIVTTHEAPALGLRVEETAFVRPDRDVLVLHVDVTRLPGGPANTTLVLFENLAPCTWKIPYLPMADWLLDVSNDFAAAYSASDDAVLHFRPNGIPDYVRLMSFALSNGASDRAQVDAWVSGADAAFGPGSYFAIGPAAASTGVQVGANAEGRGPVAGAGPVDAYADAQDGALIGNPFAAVRATAAFARDLTLGATPAGETFYIAAGPSADGPDGARTALRWARGVPYADHLAASLADWRAFSGRARLPQTANADVLRLCRRGLVAVRTAADRRTGAIVASIATQLPYAQDWPRDGSFINRALDEAGYPEMVTRHNEFYAGVQRRGWLLPGTLEMNYYADGVPGGPIAFEIDNAALAVWSMADHASFITDPVERARYLGVVYPAIRRGANFIASWRDPFSGLPLPANEDDHPQLTQGLQGSASIILALDAAQQVGPQAGETQQTLDRWRNRRDELRNVVLARFWDAARGTLEDGTGNCPGASAWALWPAPVFPAGDPRALRQGDFLWNDLQLTFSGARTQSGYDTKLFLSLAVLWANDPQRRADLRDLFERVARDLPTPGTGHLGEFYRIRTGPGGAVLFENVNDMPHIWEHSLAYLAAMRLY